MPATESNFDNKPFLSIVSGTICQKVDENTPGAVRRDYELKDGTHGTKYELKYPGWKGLVRDWKVVPTDYGDALHVVFDDAVLSLAMDGRYAIDFIRKFASADKHREVVLSPYDFVTDDGKRKSGVTLNQGEEKLKDHFASFNQETRETAYRDGFPAPESNKMDKDDWKVYFLTVKKFLKSYVTLNPLNTIGDTTETEVSIIPPEHNGSLDDIEF